MPRPGRNRRALWVTFLSIALFGWCALSAQPADNARFAASLHRAHQGDRFAYSLAELNASVADGDRLNGCTACHQDRGLVDNLLTERPVASQACAACHRPSGEKQMLTIGRPLGTRIGRPAHLLSGPGLGPTPVGLRTTPDGRQGMPVACGSCHPDHKGPDFVDREHRIYLTALERTRPEHQQWVGRVSLNEECMDCHVPDRQPASPAAGDVDAVLKNFLDPDKHLEVFLNEDASDNLKWEILRARRSPLLQGLDGPSALMAREDDPAGGAAFKAQVEAVRTEFLQRPREFDARNIVRAAMLRDDQPGERRCTGACHGEHTRGSNDSRTSGVELSLLRRLFSRPGGSR